MVAVLLGLVARTGRSPVALRWLLGAMAVFLPVFSGAGHGRGPGRGGLV